LVIRNAFLAALAVALVSSVPVQAAGLGDLASGLQFYAHLTGGVSLPGTIRVDSTPGSNGSAPFSGTMSFDAGPAFGIGVGARVTDNLRAEFNVTAATNNATSYNLDFPVFGNFQGPATGSVQTVNISAVGFFDFTQFGDFVPYLDAGFGVTTITANNLMTSMTPTGVTSGTSTVPALRVGAGFRYNVTEHLSIGADYALMVGTRATLSYSDPPNANNRTITTDVMGHAASVSLHLTF
jgi:opacity protein-like surface antigen